MGELSKLERGIALIREAFADQEADLKADLIARITGDAKSAPKLIVDERPKRGKAIRAPRGAAKAFVTKVLREHPKSRFDDVMGKRTTTAEKSISPATIRKELLRGRERGEYEGERGVYSLAK